MRGSGFRTCKPYAAIAICLPFASVTISNSAYLLQTGHFRYKHLGLPKPAPRQPYSMATV